MQSTYAAPLARLGPLAMALIVLGLMAMPVPARARDAVAAPGLLEGRRIALEDPLVLLGDADAPQHRRDHALGRHGGRPEVPGLSSDAIDADRTARERVVGARDGDHERGAEHQRHADELRRLPGFRGPAAV